MSYQEKNRLVAFTIILALVGLLIVVLNTSSLYPPVMFYGMIVIIIGLIVTFSGYAFLWEHATRYIRRRLRKRKRNILARRYFGDFKDFVDRFTSFREFNDLSQGITGLMMQLNEKTPKYRVLINARTNDFNRILRDPLNDLKQRLKELSFSKSEINNEITSCLVKQFENHIKLHKELYVDFFVITAREIGLENLLKNTKGMYTEYKDNYNQFIVAYTEFARRSAKATLWLFTQHLPKANAL